MYPRITDKKISPKEEVLKKVHHVDAPIMEISSTFIRKAIKEGKNVRPLLPEATWVYMDEMNFYK